MNITYIHQYFATPKSSGGIRSYLIAKSLVNKGHNVNMLTSSAFVPKEWDIKKGWNLVELEGMQVHVLHLPYSNKTSFIRRLYVFFVFMLRTFFKSIKVKSDLIYATSTPLTVAIPAVLCSKLKCIPFIFEVRDVWPDIPIAMGFLNNKLIQKVAKMIELFAYKHARHIVALSEGMSSRINNKGIDNSKISVVENFSDNALFGHVLELDVVDPLKKIQALNGKKLVYTGTFGAVNNLKYLIDLAEITQNKSLDITFILIGDGKEKDELHEYAIKKNVLNKTLVFFDPIRKDELPWVLSNCDAAISTVLPIPELWDNSANKFFDSLAAGLPIIINYGGWQADLINEMGCGIVLNSSINEAAAEKLVLFLDDVDRFDVAKKMAKKLAVEKFDTNIQTGKICMILESFF
tara:strand:- start:2576 stop:3793 length:1218 start_codon:yes stop_codon:yes gene_type:complete